MSFITNKRFNAKSAGMAAMTLILGATLLSGCGAGKETAEDHSTASNSAANPAEQSNTSNATETTGANAAETPAPRIVQDELGNEVELPENPEKVFAPFMEDSLISLGVTPVAQWANGNQVHDYLQDRLQGVPKADFSGGMPSPEALMALEPDLIILHTAGYAGKGVYEQYSKVAPTYVFKNAAGDLDASITKLGELLGKTSEAEEALKAYR